MDKYYTWIDDSDPNCEPPDFIIDSPTVFRSKKEAKADFKEYVAFGDGSWDWEPNFVLYKITAEKVK